MSPLFRHPSIPWLSLGLGVLGVMAAGSSCAKPSNDAARVDSAVQRLQSGQAIRQMNDDHSAAFSGASGQLSTENVPAAELLDPCPGVPRPAGTEAEVELRVALTQLGACMRVQLGPASVAKRAFAYFSDFRLDAGARPLSSMTDGELDAFLRSNWRFPMDLVGAASSPARDRLRSSFSDPELDELQALASRRRQALAGGEAKVFAAIDARRALVDHFAASNDRYAAFVALRLNANDSTGGARTAEALATAISTGGLPVPGDLSRFPVSLLHPYAIEALVPDPGQELDALHPVENPFAAMSQVLAELGGPEAINQQLRQLYREARDHDNPAIPSHAAASARAARVAVVDTGIDFVKYQDLALFLGSGTQAPGNGAQAGTGAGPLLSHDYADGDANPWIPSLGELAHGSGTSATVLTILAHYAPEVLRARQLELAVWKVETTRDVLAGPFGRFGSWNNRLGVQEAIIDQIRSPGAKPDVVSISMTFPIAPVLAQIRQADLIRRAPWLWVMAAGNEGVEVSKDPMPACFSDVAPEQRDDSRILCVGALLQGVVNDRIAGYSNFGDRVDVYAYQSYIDLCPNGTSCATPAVSSAAALLKAEFPSLTAQQLKQVIVQSAEERTLEVDPDGYHGPAPAASPDGDRAPLLRAVKVFDPATMMARAIENARRMAGGR